jgi:hypothetical protein
MKRQVFVNFSLRVMSALSGTVTSSRRTALSLHDVVAVDGVPSGVVVVDGSSVDVGGMSVGRDKPGRVGGRVEVTKIGTAGAGVSSETLTHEPRLRLAIRRSIQSLFIQRLYNEIINQQPRPN